MFANSHFRAYRRHSVQLWAVVRDSELGEDHHARTLNLGLGGACIELAATLQVGHSVFVEIRAPTLWDPLMLCGMVAWTSAAQGACRVGVCFDHQDPAGLFALMELLSAQGEPGGGC